MYLAKNPKETMNAVHGVDYTKGLESGIQCGRIHPYNTVRCRPILYTEEDVKNSSKPEQYVDYDSLTEREKLELGEPLFFGSPLHRALTEVKIRQLTEIAEIDVFGRTRAIETRVREEIPVEDS